MHLTRDRARIFAVITMAGIAGGLIPAVTTSIISAVPAAAQTADSYVNAVLADSPLSYWRLNDSSSTAFDRMHNVNGSVQGGVTLLQPGPIPGGAAMTFNGSTGYVSLGTPGSLDPQSWSVEAWFQTTTAYSNEANIYRNADFGANLYACCNNGGIAGDMIDGSNTWHGAASSVSYNDGKWHYAVFAHGTSTLNLFIDGALKATTTTATGTRTGVGGIAIGRDGYHTDGYFQGSIAEVAVYDHALGASQVAAHYQASSRQSYVSTVLADFPSSYWRLNDTGGTAVDEMGNNNGTLNGGVTTAQSGPIVNGAAMSFNGSTGYVWLGSPGMLDPQLWSVEAWFKTTTVYLNEANIYRDAQDGANLYACCNSGGIAGDMLDSTGTYHSVATGANYADGKWHYAVFTHDSSSLKMYLDGILIGTTATATGTAHNLSGIAIGRDGSNSDGYFNGSIAEVAAYDHALSGAQVVHHFQAAGMQTQPVGGPVLVTQAASGGQGCSTATAAPLHGNATGNPVDTESGNFWHNFSDVSIAGRSCPLKVERSYNSQSASTNSPFGYGWQFNYGMALTVTGTSPNQVATISEENGSQVTFNQPGSGSSWSPAAPRFIATLVHNADGTWTFQRQGRYTYGFNSSGQFTSITDLNGYATALSYTAGQLTSITDPAGRTLALGWTGSNITSVTDGNVTPNRSLTYSYDGSGNLQDVTDVNGGDTHFTYDTSHRMLTMKDPKCQALGSACPGIQNHYDAGGRIDWQKDQLNRQTSFSYAGTPGDGNGGTTTVTDPKGNVTVDGYQFGLRTSVTRGYGTAQAATTKYLYDPATLVMTAVIDPNGNQATQTVDSNGNVLTTTDDLGRTVAKTYNSFNEPLTVRDGNGVTTTYTYDSHGNLSSSSRPLSGTACPCQVTTYNRADSTHPGDVTSMVDSDSKTTTYGYDTYGDRNATTDPLGDKATTVFNADGWMTSSVSPKGNVSGCGCASTYTSSYGYNAFGQVTTVTDPLGHGPTRHYDADGNLDSSTDADGNITTYVYDVANQQTQVKRADSPQTVVTTDYNADGTVLDQKDGKNNAIQTYAYDPLARVSSVTDALSNTTAYTYDAAGNRLTQQDPGGNCTTTPKTGCISSTYDAGNQLTSVTYSDGVTPNITAITYDGDGQRTSMSDGTGTSFWTTDNLNRLTSYTNGGGAQVQWSYNLRNLVTSITYPGSKTVNRGYDDAGRWTSVQDFLSPSNTTSFGYDANSNLTTETFSTGSGVVDTFSVDAADRIMSISSAKGSTSLFAATYTRDNANQVTSDSSIATTTASYKYTPRNQVCYAGSSSTSACSSPPTGSQPFSYDAADNLTSLGSTTQQFNAADQLCWTLSGSSSNACGTAPTGSTTYAYDTRGNRTSTTPATGPGTSYSYDQANHLTTWTQGSATTTYGYDGDGLRMTKTSASTTSQFVWDPTQGLPLLLRDGPSTNYTYYVYGPGGLPVEQVNGTNALFYHHDQLGSIRLLTDASGAAQATYSYDPYGNLTASSGSVANPFRFTGQYLDAESGLYYLRARYYDPVTANFLSRDPALWTTRAPYGYADDNPLNEADPTGLCSWNPFDSNSCEIAEPSKQVSSWAGDINHFINDNTFGFCIQGSAGLGVGVSGSACVEANAHSFGLTGTAGAGVEIPGGVSLTAGPQLGLGAHDVSDLGGPFTYAGASGGEGYVGGLDFAYGTGNCGQTVTTITPSLGVGLNLPWPVSGHAGASNTWVWQP
ncbi:MAG TPA: LamG-like jellyroll fold domain-containing protein [Candidatus Angelobacter sp.]|jgi:RHS repeat-associated protein|nr:LamG-like jellyroll fold domain-containing protein [Candidatus Angelobacter sp.]